MNRQSMPYMRLYPRYAPDFDSHWASRTVEVGPSQLHPADVCCTRPILGLARFTHRPGPARPAYFGPTAPPNGIEGER